MDIAAWLRELALERYEQAFRENEIDREILPKLTADDLKDIGVTIVGHRRKLLEAIAALAEPPLAPHAEPSASAEVVPKARSVEAERRQLTVMFVDLVGSTKLSAQIEGREERDSGGRTMGVVSNMSTSAEENSDSRTYTPIPTPGPIPPQRRRGTGLRREDDGGGLKHLKLNRQKSYR